MRRPSWCSRSAAARPRYSVAAGPLVHLIDGPVWVFRAYYSLPEMKAPDGTPTNAAYGYTSTLLKYLTEHEPTHVAVAFDYSMESFRNESFPDYKAQRGETPDDLEEIHARMCELAPDIVKVVTMANSVGDLVRMLSLVKNSTVPTVGFCMGEIGTPSRILCGRFGAPFTKGTPSMRAA